MTVLDLHPEELLDRDARGELTAQESERLERHLSQCKTCRLERKVRGDFRVDEDPRGAEFDVQRLLSEVLAPGAERDLLRPAPERRRRSVRNGLRPLLLVAATLFVAGVSAAAGVVFVGRAGPSTSAATEPASRAVAPVAAVALSPAPPVGAVNPPPPPAPAPEAVLPLAPVGSPGPAPQIAATYAAVAPPALPLSTGPAASIRVPSVPGVALPASTPTTVTAAAISEVAALFERANRARRAGDHGRAAELYRALLQRFPQSPEAHESQAVLGRELLGDGEAGTALRYFDDYLQSGGALREDVMADRALALGRLGRERDEAEAWGALLHAYPGSVHADRAASRLRELGL